MILNPSHLDLELLSTQVSWIGIKKITFFSLQARLRPSSLSSHPLIPGFDIAAKPKTLEFDVIARSKELKFDTHVRPNFSSRNLGMKSDVLPDTSFY
jgi:hypothetical protein